MKKKLYAPVTWSFQDVPVDEAVTRLLARVSSVALYAPAGDGAAQLLKTPGRSVRIGRGVQIGSNVRVDRFVRIANNTVVADNEHLRRQSRRQLFRRLFFALLARLGFFFGGSV